MHRFAIALTVFLFAAFHARAADAPPPLISVTGTAEILVVPDEVTLSLGISVVDKDISKSRSDCDGRVRRVLEIAKEHGVQDKDVHTDQITIGMKSEKHVKDGEERWDFLGYESKQGPVRYATRNIKV